ncbi:hypothetical protein IV203_038101 [Nitzschia inconspicua]|uniref:Uncharacterized protein n=1 Tax=Nitzschia inconspicua TaxID=303405 RepID=A0A9K3LM70_9STRA|nr:hypothetical protein IV203_038101 [Nitzschia inconspicua]
MTCSGDVLVTLLLLGVGLLAATVHLQNKGHQLSNSIVAPPMIGMASQQGPWPKCLGLSVESCESYILSVFTRESLCWNI